MQKRRPWGPPSPPLIIRARPEVPEAPRRAPRPGDQELVGRMLALAPKLMRELGVTNGFRTLINTGKDGLQEVYHLHMHVMGGPRPWLKG